MKYGNENFTVLKNLVGTQYGDLTGIIQIDGHNNISEMYDLCAKNGISRDKYFLIGIGFSEFTTDGIGLRGSICCKVLLLETEKYAQSFDEIKSQLVITPKVDVIMKTFYVDYADLRKYIKRVDSMLLTQMGNYIKEMNIIEEE